jgi:predicted dehydrogenase
VTLRVGIVGGGLITQVEHLPNLLALPSLFTVAGLADPSAKVRTALSARYGIPAFATADELLAQPLDGVVIATPDAYHADLTVAALERGLHVFSEKPLCYDVADARRIAAARDRAGRVMQVGYMKRFDPAYLALRELLKKQQGPLRAVTVDVIDPDSGAFTDHHDMVIPDDIPQALIEEAGERKRAQVHAALGFVPEPPIFSGFSGPYSAALVHDLNLVQGLLEPLGVAIGTPLGAGFIAGGHGCHLTAQLTPGEGLVTMTWVAAPQLAYYCERISLVFDDANYELRFPSPYLNHHLTTLIERRASGYHLEEISHRPSYAEPFVEELKAFHAAITTGAPVVNTVEQAATDMGLFATFARLAASRT